MAPKLNKTVPARPYQLDLWGDHTCDQRTFDTEAAAIVFMHQTFHNNPGKYMGFCIAKVLGTYVPTMQGEVDCAPA